MGARAREGGMRQEGFPVEKLKIHGVWKSSFLYAMLVEEWNGAAFEIAVRIRLRYRLTP